MPTALPARPRGITRWLVIGLMAGFAAISLTLWITQDGASKATAPNATTGFAPADQSGKPFPR